MAPTNQIIASICGHFEAYETNSNYANNYRVFGLKCLKYIWMKIYKFQN